MNSYHFEAKAFVFLSLGDEDKWCGSCNHVPEGERDQQANQMMSENIES